MIQTNLQPNLSYPMANRSGIYLTTLFLFLLLACSEEKNYVSADFSNLMTAGDHEAAQEETVGVFGGAEKQQIDPVTIHYATFNILDKSLVIEMDDKGYLRFTPRSAKLPESWRNSSHLLITIESRQPANIIFEAFGSRSRTHDTLRVHPGKNEYTIDMRETHFLGGVNAQPTHLVFRSDEAASFAVSKMRLYFLDEPIIVVDRFGQRNLKQYPEKVNTWEELVDFTPELSFFDSLRSESNNQTFDRFGGYVTDQISFTPTGFFHTTYANDRWWLVTPDGNPFFSLGVNGVRRKSFRGTADVSRIEGREEIFEHIPFYHECPECFFDDSIYFSHYAWNVKQKYDDYDHWKTYTDKRLTTVGFNTIGNWSDTLFYNHPVLPYTFTLDTRRNPDLRTNTGLPDVFHPDWPDHVDKVCSAIKQYKDDPFLLGYFVDNEINWRSIPDIDTTSYTGRYLREIEGDEEKMTHFAEQYFSVIQEKIQKYAPNHLYIGCRFTSSFEKMEGVTRMAGKYSDILSVNVYSAYPIRNEMDRWYNAAQKPLLIGEHHIPPQTPRQLWPVYQNFPDHERYPMIENYVLTWASYPYALGSHWYQFKDQEVAGRGSGGENQPIGIITVADKPNRQLLETYFRISQQLWDVILP